MVGSNLFAFLDPQDLWIRSKTKGKTEKNDTPKFRWLFGGNPEASLLGCSQGPFRSADPLDFGAVDLTPV